MKKFRLLFLAAGILLAYFGLSYRLLHIQVLDFDRFSSMAERSYFVQVDKVSPPRGRIYDGNGIPLAVNKNTYSVGYSPVRTEKPDNFIPLVSQSLNIPVSQVRNRIIQGRFSWLKRHAEPSEVRDLMSLRNNGLVINRENHRFYPQSPLASHLIGCVGMDNQGLSGIEFNYEHHLRGGHGEERRIRDARGRLIYSASTRDEVNIPADIHLTIDSNLQQIAERELKLGYERYSPNWALAIIQRPDTGEILAMAFYPGYDNNSEIPSAERMKNIAVSNIFEPGSTYKIVTAAAALEEGIARPEDIFFCENGEYEVGGFPIRDFHSYGDLSLTDIMVHSSNIGTAKIGAKLGRNLMYKYSRDFGFGTFSGIRLPGEARGILRKPDSWSGTSLSRISFGQEVGITAIQLVGAFSVIANGGSLYEPQILSKMVQDGRSSEAEPLLVRRVLSNENADILRGMLHEAVERGTGHQAKVSGYTVAGKTGTAQKFNPETLTYARDRYVASFCGFVPAENPELTILVVFDEPHKSLYWGGYVAAPVFSRIASRALNYLNIPPDASELNLVSVR